MKNYLIPFYEGDTVYDESIFPVIEKNKNKADGIYARTIFNIDFILSVTDSKKQITYEAGRDYVIKDGKFFIPADSSIPMPGWEIYNPAVAPKASFTIECTLGGYLLFGETDQITKYNCLVTYKHKENKNAFSEILQKYNTAQKLPLFREKIKNRDEVTFAFYGDSITVGANSSGMNGIDLPPYQPIFPVMVCEKIEELGVKVNYLNKAVGGTTSKWGVDNFDQEFSGTKPDIMLIGFGMNDGSGRVPCEEYIANTKTIIEKAVRLNPDMEFAVVATMLPNELAKGFFGYQNDYFPLLEKLVEECGNRAVMVPMTALHNELLKYKNYYDMTGNNVNHPNDFFAAVYTHAICGVIL